MSQLHPPSTGIKAKRLGTRSRPSQKQGWGGRPGREGTEDRKAVCWPPKTDPEQGAREATGVWGGQAWDTERGDSQDRPPSQAPWSPRWPGAEASAGPDGGLGPRFPEASSSRRSRPQLFSICSMSSSPSSEQGLAPALHPRRPPSSSQKGSSLQVLGSSRGVSSRVLFVSGSKAGGRGAPVWGT